MEAEHLREMPTGQTASAGQRWWPTELEPRQRLIVVRRERRGSVIVMGPQKMKWMSCLLACSHCQGGCEMGGLAPGSALQSGPEAATTPWAMKGGHLAR